MKSTRILALALATLFSASSAFAAEHVVTQKGKKFIPAKVDMKAGDTLVVRNEDRFVHNVYSKTKGYEFNTKAQKQGFELKVKFDKKGVVDVRCAMHPKMRLTVNVQ